MKPFGWMAIAAALSLSTPLQAEDLTFTGFGGSLQDSVRKTMLDSWAGGKITEETYNGGIAKLKAMVQSDAVIWDVVQMDENEMLLACDEGLLETFDWSAKPEADQLIEAAKSDCGVGAFVWSLVPTYDGAKIQSIDGWNAFWDLQQFPGKRGFRKVARGTMEIALIADGVAPDDIYSVLATPEGQARAFAKLDQIKPQIQWWESGAQPVEWLASGDLVMTAAYNGRVVVAQREGRDFKIQWHNQLYAMDYWAIPKGAKPSAMALVDHMISGPSQSAFAKEILYGVTNSTAELDPAYASELPTAPQNMQDALAISTPFWLDHEEELQQRFNTWVAQ